MSSVGNKKLANCLIIRCLTVALFLFIASNEGFAQKVDSLKKSKPDSIGANAPLVNEVKMDSLGKKKVKVKRESDLALYRAAIFPGLGQIYNKKYWKLPIVYGGFVAIGYAINFNQNYYQEFLREYKYRTAGNPYLYPQYQNASTEQIISAKDYYKRYRDLSIIGMIAFYGVQIIDAYVDAELSNFDVSDDLAMKIAPTVQPTQLAYGSSVPNNYYVGVSLKFTLK
ncbi:hypothetical protein SAMN06265350_10193 [Solitalea koreensis]|uniref:DUF5683 domain-containing protein n=1 Tax=Solitalea koreensis TaxID=543615 RepID=A0A521AF13_9SPHI|nr:hypothetical protein SAMN06265350_10193 [Solitalea koreensis]